MIELTSNLSRLSPVGSFAISFTNLATTGLVDNHVFENDLSAMLVAGNQAYRSYQNSQNGDSSGPPRTPISVPTSLIEAVQDMFDVQHKFKFTKASLSDSTESITLDASLMFLWAGVFFSVAAIKFSKYDVR